MLQGAERDDNVEFSFCFVYIEALIDKAGMAETLSRDFCGPRRIVDRKHLSCSALCDQPGKFARSTADLQNILVFPGKFLENRRPIHRDFIGLKQELRIMPPLAFFIDLSVKVSKFFI